MPLFMFLSGSSVYFALKKRRKTQFVMERVQRIFIPLVLGILVIVPPQVYCERLFQGKFTGSFWSFYPHFFEGIYPNGNFSWHHLWFLSYLFVYSILALPVFNFFSSTDGYKVRERLVYLLQKPFGLLIFTIPLAFFHVLLFWRYPPTNAMVNDWGWHSQLFLLFIFGFILVSDKRIEQLISKSWQFHLNLAAFLTLLFFCLRSFDLSNDSDLFWIMYCAKGIVYRLCGWTWILAFMGLSHKYLNKNFRSLDRLAEGAYPFYILHQTMIVFVAVTVVSLPLSIGSKFVLLFLFALALTLIVYAILSQFRVTRFILGMK